MRGIRVITYSAPFYAGSGLTEDCAINHPAWVRRKRRLTLDQLCAATLLLYPRYWDAQAQFFDTAERACTAIGLKTDQFCGRAKPDAHSPGFWRRQRFAIE